MLTKIKRIVRCKAGFTLVEIVLAMAVLGIVILAYTALFTSSFQGIFTSGHKTRALYEAQQEVENRISGGTDLQQNMTITFPGKTIVIKGEEAEVDYEYQDHQGSITFFIPGD